MSQLPCKTDAFDQHAQRLHPSPERCPTREAISLPIAMAPETSYGSRDCADGTDRSSRPGTPSFQCERLSPCFFCRTLWRPAHGFPESNQPQCHDAPQRHRRTPTLRRVALEPFRADTTLEGGMTLCHEPAGCLRERTPSGRRAAGDLCLTQHDPFHPFVLVRRWCPDAHCGTREARWTAQSSARTPRGTALDGGGAEEERGSPRWVMGPPPPLQDPCA